jgi:putative transposase
LLSYTRFRALLSQPGYVWRQPKHDLSALQDEQAQQVAQQVLDWLKKRPRLSHRRFPTPLPGRNDLEFASAPAPLLDEMWSAQAHPGSRHTAALPCLGAYNWHSGHLAWLNTLKKNSQTFIAFVEHLAFTVYPDQHLILVMDNASHHKSRATLAASVALEDRILVVWLPKYSPFLNPIEPFWLHLNNLANANGLHPDLDSLIRTLDDKLTSQNTPGHPDRLKFVENLRSAA